MKRRTLMQWLMSLPFLSGFKTAPQKKETGHVPLNGTVWQAPWPCCRTVIVLFLDAKDGVCTYALLSRPYKAADLPGTVVMLCSYDNGIGYGVAYPEVELLKKLSRWKHRPDLELRLWDREKKDVEYI